MEQLHRVVVVAAWIGMLIWAYRGDSLGRWWCSAALLTAAATLSTPGTGGVVDTAVGLTGLSASVAHAAVTAAAGLALRAQLAAARPTSTTAARASSAYLLVAPTVAIATGLLAAPPVHGVLYYGAVGVAAAVFALSGYSEIRELTAGRPRAVAQLLTAAAVAVAAWAGLATMRTIAAPIPEVQSPQPQTPQPVALVGALDIGAGGFLALAAACAGAGLVLAVVHRRDTVGRSGEQIRDVLALWNWLCDTGNNSVDLFGVVIETRDRLWLTQRWVDVDDLAAATHLARRLGLGGQPARAFITAVCLEIGLCAIEDNMARPAESADLSRLGGGTSPEEEAAWFAAVWRSRIDHHAAAAAAVIRYASHSITESGRGTVMEP
jgi:hypothetical protein